MALPPFYYRKDKEIVSVPGYLNFVDIPKWFIVDNKSKLPSHLKFLKEGPFLVLGTSKTNNDIYVFVPQYAVNNIRILPSNCALYGRELTDHYDLARVLNETTVAKFLIKTLRKSKLWVRNDLRNLNEVDTFQIDRYSWYLECKRRSEIRKNKTPKWVGFRPDEIKKRKSMNKKKREEEKRRDHKVTRGA